MMRLLSTILERAISIFGIYHFYSLELNHKIKLLIIGNTCGEDIQRCSKGMLIEKIYKPI